MKDIFFSGLIILLFVNMILPIALWFISKAVAFWTRERSKPRYGFKYQKLKWSWTCKNYDNDDAFAGYFIFDVGLGLVTTVALAFIATELSDIQLLVLSIVTGCMVAFFVLPRYIIDLNHTLKMKGGDSKRIDELEQQINELKNQ